MDFHLKKSYFAANCTIFHTYNLSDLLSLYLKYI